MPHYFYHAAKLALKVLKNDSGLYTAGSISIYLLPVASFSTIDSVTVVFLLNICYSCSFIQILQVTLNSLVYRLLKASSYAS